MGAQTTPGSTEGHSPKRAGRGRGVLLGALTAALLPLSAGVAAASPVETPPSPQHPHIEVPADLPDQACAPLHAEPFLPDAGDVADGACRDVNGWQ